MELRCCLCHVVCVYARGLGCVVYADARRLYGGAPHARHTDAAAEQISISHVNTARRPHAA